MAEYISRDDVLRKFIEGNGHDDDRFTEGYNFAVQEYREEVKKIPAADVQPIQRGKWIGVDYDTYFECSECKHMTDWQLYKYCPYCGARMDLKGGDTNG